MRLWRLLLIGAWCCLAAAPALAQITIDEGDLPRAVGDSWYFKYAASSATVSVGTTGGPQTWTFDTASYAGYVLATGAVDIAGTPFAGQFPDADVALREERGPWTLYYYRNIEPSAVLDLGHGLVTADTSVAYPYAPAGVHLELPATLGTDWQTTYSYHDSLDDTTCNLTTYAKDCRVDAWGTVTTAAGTWPCLRANTIELVIMGRYINGGQVYAETSLTRRYYWFTEGAGSVAMAHSMEGDTNPGFTEADDVMILTRTNAAAVEEGATSNAPGIRRAATLVRGSLLLGAGLGTRSELPDNSVMSRAVLLDVSGRNAFDLVPGPNDVSGLAPGVYFVRTASSAYKVLLTR